MGKFLFIGLFLFVGQSVHAVDTKSCADKFSIQLLDDSAAEPITIVFNKYSEYCSSEEYEARGGFWGHSDDIFDDVSLELYTPEKNGFVWTEFHFDGYEGSSSVYAYRWNRREKIAEIVQKDGREYLKILRPYKIVASENKIYID